MGGATPAYGAIITRRGIVAIKPLGLGDILDGAFKAIRHNPRVMIGMALLVVTLATILSVIPVALSFASSFTALTDGLDSLPTDAAPDEVVSAIGGPLSAILGGSVIGSLIATLGALLLNGILIVSVGQSVIDRRISFSDAWHRVRGRILPLFGQSILLSLIIATPFVLVVLLAAFLVSVVDPVVGVVVGLALLLGAMVLAVYLSVVWSLGPAVLVLERLGPIASLGRSRRLLRGAFWRTLGILLLTSLIVGVLTQVLSIPISVIAQIIPFLGTEDQVATLTVIALVVSYVGTSLVTVLIYPFLAAVISLLYIDRRIRTEGLDVALNRAMAQST